ncbi:hypothetical protein TNCV_3137201 [Trichonephila clavipes]|nr:hypothetical protein TNCV_3137201 [Trichonephila clavipes]
MDDNARPHREAPDLFEVSGGSRFGTNGMASSISRPESDRASYGDYLGREVAALNSSRSLHELKQALCVTSLRFPIPVSDNLINSMGNRCRQCIPKSKGTWIKVSVRSFFHGLQCTSHISDAWTSEHSRNTPGEFRISPAATAILATSSSQHCQRGCHKLAISYDPRNKNQRHDRSGDRAGQRTGPPRPIHC